MVLVDDDALAFGVELDFDFVVEFESLDGGLDGLGEQGEETLVF